MKMNNTIRGLATLLLLLLAVSVTGCFDEVVEPTYDGPPKVQFDPTSDAVLDGQGVVPINIQLIAPHQSDDSRFPISVVDSLTSAAPENYELLTETAVIPADSSFGTVRVDVSGIEIPPGEQRVLALALNDSEDGEITPAKNFQIFELTIVGPSANVVVDPSTVNFGEVPVDSTASTTIDVANVIDGFAGTLSTEISNFQITGDGAGAYDLVSPTDDSVPLPSADTSEVVVEFTPPDTSDYAAQLSFDLGEEDPSAESLSIDLMGSGIEDED